MKRRSFMLLLGPGLLAGCGSQSGGYYPAGPGMLSPQAMNLGRPSAGAAQGQRAGILVPLSGPRADIGPALLNGAQLALKNQPGPTLDSKDTGGTPPGAANAARELIGGGAGILLGPLTSAETAAVAPVAREAGVPVLSFTNDPAQAQPGVWTLGITPGQQVRRLVAAAQGQGKVPIAAMLPDSDFGHAMGQALQQAANAAALPPPDIHFHGQSMAAIQQATRDVSGYATRRGPLDAQIKEARAQGTLEGRREARELAMRGAVPPPSFAALLLGATGEQLAEIAAMLPYYDVDRSQVQVMGPALWAASASGSGQFPGAWYAAPDPAARAGFEQAYSAAYDTPPPAIADLGYDAVSIARVLAGSGGFSVASLTQPAGFTGVDGWLALLPDGEVRRGLAVFRIERGGPAMVEPAPQNGSVAGV